MLTQEKPGTTPSSTMRAICAQTIESIGQQKTLPDSPCTTSEAESLLCAGALAVRAGLALTRSEEEADAFERELLSTRDTDLILRQASKAGLPETLVRDMVFLNDSLENSSRVDGMINYFNDLMEKV
jgi:hypothetical protein